MEVREEIRNIFLRTFDMKPEDFSFEKKQSEYERWDSFANMQLISEIENKLNVTFEVEEVIGIESAADIVKLVKKKKGENG
jgi:acyl carrier protein